MIGKRACNWSGAGVEMSLDAARTSAYATFVRNPLVLFAVFFAIRAFGQVPDEQALRDALAAHPDDSVLQRTLGEFLMRRQFDNAEAGKLLAAASKAAPRDPEARHYYAQWTYMNDRERICAEQEKAALLLPGLNDLARLQMNTLLGLCLGKLEDAAGARAAFRRAEEINNSQKNYDPMASWQYLQFLTRFGVDADAQGLAGRILKHVPNFSPALLERAKYFDRSGQPEKAIEQAQLTLQGGGVDVNVERAAHGVLARSYMALGQSDNAEREQSWIQAHANPETPNKIK
jgi:tetratricopeptide (TPR) repeat protein